MDTSKEYIKMCDCHEIQERKKWLWLPSQDQIQEMLGCQDIQVAHHRLYQLADFWIGRDLKSLEQLWLAFYMWEKYKKEWNDEKWVKK